MSGTVSCELSNSTVTEVFPPNHVAAVYTRDSPSGAHLDVINKSQEWARFELNSACHAQKRKKMCGQLPEILAGFKNISG